jgi:hypothetical protein
MQLVSLITDFGNIDYNLAQLKAGLLSKCKDISIIDSCNDVKLHDIVSASFILKNVFSYFKEGSIHIVAVNNHYDEKPKYLCFKYRNQYFIGPDNGVFSLAIDDFESIDIWELNSHEDHQSPTDWYIHACACITHELPFEEFSTRMEELTVMIDFQPVINSHQLRASIIYIDHYGNAVTNLSKKTFEEARQGRKFMLYFNPHDPLDYVSKSYSSVGVGEVLCRFNKVGLLEIAINMGDASVILNLHKNETIQIDFI